MADSIDKKNEDTSEDFADDLDAMLNHVESSLDESEELIEDEDAIDQLLMDDAFDMAAEGADDEVFNAIIEEKNSVNTGVEQLKEIAVDGDDGFDEFSDENDFNDTVSNNKKDADEFSEYDEFSFDGTVSSDDEQVTDKYKKSEEVEDDDDFNVENILSSAAEEPKSPEHAEAAQLVDNILETAVNEDTQAEEELVPDVETEEVVDEFDVDELIASESNDQENSSEVEIEKKVEPEPEAEADDTANDDFLMADFDISSDDELLESDESESEGEIADSSEEIESSAEDNIELESEKEEIESAEFAALKKEVNAQGAVVEQTSQDLTKINSAIDELNAQISQLKSDNEAFKTQVTELTASITERDQSTSKEIDAVQKDQRKLKKVVQENETKVPTIVYVVMAIAILALLVGGGLGIVGYSAQTDVESLTELVSTIEEEVEMNSAKDSSAEVRELKLKIKELQNKDISVNRQLDVVNRKIDKPNTLKAVVDDLVEQNDHAQVAIEKLLATVGTLEQQQKVVVAPKKKVKKIKKAVVRVEWIVHLVSFKQEWYGKRKAEEFEKKGIPAKVERVEVNGEIWFRLSVKGFKTKYEAAAYAVKVKKTLNLTSVWVTKA